MNASKGMTMLEVVVWISAFTFVTLAIVSSVIYFYRTNTYTIGQASAVSSAQRGVDRMIRTIREASYASNGAYAIISIADNDFQFYADVDADPFIEKVHYSLTSVGSSTVLTEGIVNPVGDPPAYSGAEATTSVSYYVRNLDAGLATTTFKYFTKTGTQITDYTRAIDVRFVTVTAVVDTDTSQKPDAVTLRSSAALRNLIGR
jgi:hypothetical protein